MNKIVFIFWGFYANILFSNVSRIPIQSYPFLSYQRFIHFQIDGEQYLGLIDTGCAFSMLRKDVLNEIQNKTYVSESEYTSVRGKSYITSNYKISEVKIGDFLAETIFKEEDENFWTDGSAIDDFSFIHSLKIYLMYQIFREAVIGIDLFQKFACLFDFPHSSIFLADHISDIIDENMFSTVPFDLGKAGVIVKFETDLGVKRFLLDSAATRSIIRLTDDEKKHKQGYFVTKLTLSDINFWNWEFGVFDISNEFDDMDGILGIDFFKMNIIGLDFANKLAYIQTPKLGSKERFTYWMKSYFGK